MIRLNKRTKKWSFRTVVIRADGTKERVSGTPGAPGRPYHDLENTKTGARAAELRAISDAMHGKPTPAVPDISGADEKPISEHAVTFLEKYKPDQKPSTKRDRIVCVRRLLPPLGHLTPKNLQQTNIDDFVKAELKRGIARKTINNTLGYLSCLLRYATGTKSTLRLHVEGMAGEIRAVDPADVERLLAACHDERFRAVILLASEAGLRAGEIRGLQWTDLKDEQLIVRRALDQTTNVVLSPKHDKRRNVPLSPRVAEVLAALPRRGEWIVSRFDGNVFDYWDLKCTIDAIYKRANVPAPPMVLHCLRHTFGTVMARVVPLPVLKELMGHADIKTTMRYIDINERDKRAAIALVFGKSADSDPTPPRDPADNA